MDIYSFPHSPFRPSLLGIRVGLNWLFGFQHSLHVFSQGRRRRGNEVGGQYREDFYIKSNAAFSP